MNGQSATLRLKVKAPVGSESIEIRAGTGVARRVRPYAADDLGVRLRVIWAGAEYRGRGRNTLWQGTAQVAGAPIVGFTPINRLNPELELRQVGSAQVLWRSITTGTRMGFDAVLDDIAGTTLSVRTNHGSLDAARAALGLEPAMLDAGGLVRRRWIQRLPDAPLAREAEVTCGVAVAANGDTPVWVCVTFEDGNRAWTSPAYLFRKYSVRNNAPNRAVSSQRSMPRSCSRSSTLHRDGGKRIYIMTARRMIPRLGRDCRKGLRLVIRER